jgi:hypothetical protein
MQEIRYILFVLSFFPLALTTFHLGCYQDGRSALFHAVDSDNLETVKLLLTHPDIDVNAEDDVSLF